jgi:heme/copper-type cytochrome/quinol oxidase subunit 2
MDNNIDNNIKTKNMRLALALTIIPVIMFFVMLYWAWRVYPDILMPLF